MDEAADRAGGGQAGEVLAGVALRDLGHVLRSRAATSSGFSSARFWACSSSSFFSPLRSSRLPSRRSDESPARSPAACLALPVSLSMMPISTFSLLVYLSRATTPGRRLENA